MPIYVRAISISPSLLDYIDKVKSIVPKNGTDRSIRRLLNMLRVFALKLQGLLFFFFFSDEPGCILFYCIRLFFMVWTSSQNYTILISLFFQTISLALLLHDIWICSIKRPDVESHCISIH